MTVQILVIEDDETLNRLIVKQLSAAGHDVTAVTRWGDADIYLAKHEPNLILTDVRVPDGDSMERLPELASDYPVIVLTAYGSVRDAVAAMKKGASEYLLKPISTEELSLMVNRTLENSALRQDHQFCKERLQQQEGEGKILIGNSVAIKEVQSLIHAVAIDDINVLIQGESGTGKELIARSIHQQSGRSDRNFVAVDCCTLQEKLFESELFGHEKGSFTGADRQKKGLIEGAEGGTLFLDEIGDVDATIQAKLLRFLETGKFRRVGSVKDLSADVRILSATNQDLREMVDEGRFRADLYYRLNGFNVHSPPLRERREDIPELAEHFIRNHSFSRRIKKKLTASASRKLVAYDWPGNVRELKNIVERAIILSREKSTVGQEHLAFGNGRVKQKEANINLAFDHDPTLEELEAHYLHMQLKKYSGHRAQVAETMGISERSVYRLIKRYGLTV